VINKGDDQDVQAVRREEMSRGRQPIDTSQLELKRKFKRDFEELLLNGDQKQFRLFLIALGQEESGEQFEASMKHWQSYQKNRHRSP
jgi:hypothetical protein